MINKKESLAIAFLLMIAGIVVSLPLFGNTVFAVPVQDTFFHTQRIWSVRNALAEGQFPVRIYSEIYNGYGYGAPLFYPDIFLYFPAILCLLGLPLVVSYNIFLITVNFATIILSYYAYTKISESRIIGTIAAVLYTLSAYRLLDLYTRGAIGELLALVFCPLALCGLTLIKRGEYRKWWILVIAYTGLLQSHILSFVMMAVLAVLYVVIIWKKFLNILAVRAVLKAVLVTVLLNAWFLVPLLQVSGMNVIAFLGTDSFWSTDASIVQLFDVLFLSAGGHEVYADGIAESMPKTPGVLLLVGAVLVIFVLILYSDTIEKKNKRRMWGYTASGILAALMITNLFPWSILEKITIFRSFFEKFQFMWRFNILSILFLSIAAAYGFYYFFVKESVKDCDNEKSIGYKIMLLVSMAACVFAMIFLNQFVKQAVQYGNEQVMENGYMDRMYVVPGFPYDTNGEIDSNLVTVEYLNVIREARHFTCDYTCTTFEVIDEEKPYLEVPLAYYPGYKAYIDGEEIDTECSIWGVVRVYLPEDKASGNLQVIYKENLPIKMAEMVSLLTLFALCLLPVLRRVTVGRPKTKK